jgi:hypothetical protein
VRFCFRGYRPLNDPDFDAERNSFFTDPWVAPRGGEARAGRRGEQAPGWALIGLVLVEGGASSRRWPGVRPIASGGACSGRLGALKHFQQVDGSLTKAAGGTAGLAIVLSGGASVLDLTSIERPPQSSISTLQLSPPPCSVCRRLDRWILPKTKSAARRAEFRKLAL